MQCNVIMLFTGYHKMVKFKVVSKNESRQNESRTGRALTQFEPCHMGPNLKRSNRPHASTIVGPAN